MTFLVLLCSHLFIVSESRTCPAKTEPSFIIPESRLAEAVKFIRACMEEKPFLEFDLPLIAEAAAGPTFGAMEELED